MKQLAAPQTSQLILTPLTSFGPKQSSRLRHSSPYHREIGNRTTKSKEKSLSLIKWAEREEIWQEAFGKGVTPLYHISLGRSPKDDWGVPGNYPPFDRHALAKLLMLLAVPRSYWVLAAHFSYRFHEIRASELDVLPNKEPFGLWVKKYSTV
jgi:hypothetical protein